MIQPVPTFENKKLLKPLLNVSLGSIFKREYLDGVKEVLSQTKKSFVLFYRRPRFSRAKLIFDGRCFNDDCVYVEWNNRGLKRTKKLPPFNNKISWAPGNLASLLGLEERANPQTRGELELFMKENAQISCTIFFVFRRNPRQSHVWYQSPDSETCLDNIHVNAFADKSSQIVYQLPSPNKEIKNICIKSTSGAPRPTKMFDPKKNRRSAVSLKMNSLSLVFFLGLCGKPEWNRVRQEMVRYTGYIWIDFDEKREKRFMTYKDWETSFSVALEGKYKEWQMKNFYQKMSLRMNEAREKKREALQFLTSRLEWADSPTRSLWKTCREMLERLCQRFQLVTFWPNDDMLKSLFCPLMELNEICFEKKGNGFHLGTKHNQTIFMRCPKFQVTNILCHTNQSPEVVDYQTGIEILVKKTRAWFPPNTKDKIFCNKPLSNFRFARGHLSHQTNYACLKLVQAMYIRMSDFYFESLGLDINSDVYLSQGKKSFACLWQMLAESDPLEQAIEKPNVFVNNLLRTWSHGGISFSAETELAIHQPMGEKKKKALACVNYDLNSSYGYAGINANLPTGFSVSFRRGARVYSYQRHRAFEFKAVFYTIRQLLLQGRVVRSVYSNYHPLGICCIGPYPVDLCVILEGGETLLYNFDGMYAHSCRSDPPCPPLNNFVNQKSSQELISEANKRDNFIKEYVEKGNLKYHVFSDCCMGPYNKANLEKVFLRDFRLREIIEPYEQINGNLDYPSPLTTFIAEVRGSVTSDPRNPLPPIFTWYNGKAVNLHQGTFLVTQDSYSYLKKHHQLVIDKVEAAVFYKKDFLLPKFYQKLLLERNKHGEVQSKIIKSIVNYSTGVFGSNPNNLKSGVKRLVYRLPVKFDLQTHSCLPIRKYFIVENLPKGRAEKLSFNALAVFVTIVEYGKLRILQLLDFYKNHLDPSDYRVLYIHVDSTIVALSGSHLDDTARDSVEYRRDKALLFDQEKPGMAKLEWLKNDFNPWSCITPRQQFFVLIHPDTLEGIYKMSGQSSLSPVDIYMLALKYAKRIY